MTYRSGNWAQRVGALGDESERAFDSLFPASHASGLNRPPMKVSDIDPLLRNIPDRMGYEGFIECLGFGRDRTAKFKVEKLVAQLRWSALRPVSYFVYDSKAKQGYIADIEVWFMAMIQHGQVGAFDDGPIYIGLSVEHFPVEPTDIPEVAA